MVELLGPQQPCVSLPLDQRGVGFAPADLAVKLVRLLQAGVKGATEVVAKGWSVSELGRAQTEMKRDGPAGGDFQGVACSGLGPGPG